MTQHRYRDRALNSIALRTLLVLQLSNVQTTQQPQTIAIPAGALQIGSNGQQIVQLATPTKTQAATTANPQNGTVIMVCTSTRVRRAGNGRMCAFSALDGTG